MNDPRTSFVVLVSVAAVALSSYAGPAVAHAGTGLAGGFGAGFAHPFGGMDHLLAMVAVGLWGAVLGEPLVYLLPMVFPGVMVLGAVFGMVGVPLPPVEWGIALSVCALGLCVACALRPGVGTAMIVVAVFGLFHGYAHGKELPSAVDPIGYSTGFVLATGSLHVLGIGLGMAARWPWGMPALRAVGIGIAVTGVHFVVQAARA
ncbi:HupE/UreJ family protein [Luteibacter yeojuensis]